MAKKQKPVNDHCFWCKTHASKLEKNEITRDHLMPKGMGGGNNKTVFSCRECNEERGRVTELYSARLILIENIKLRPQKINLYKNKFRKKVKKLSHLILKWEFLHREKGITLPFSILEVISLDEPAPLLLSFDSEIF